MKNRILVFGKGYVGKRIHENIDCNLSEKRILSFRDAEEELKRYRPKIIINCIGYIGKKNVDDCESDVDKTLSSNVFVPIVMAEIALRNKIKLVHISSGCIYNYNYNKDKPITEEKAPDFFDLYYSRSKIYAEKVLAALSSKFNILILRIRTPLDNRPHPRNILTKLIGYKRIIELPNSVTYIPDFIKALRYLINKNAKGIYNIVNSGPLRYPELLDVYRKFVPDFKYKVTDFHRLNIVRTNPVMSTKKLEMTGFKVRPIKKVLEECVKDYVKY